MSPSALVGSPAVFPYLAIRSGEGTNVAHPDHGGREVRAEGAEITAVIPHDGIS